MYTNSILCFTDKLKFHKYGVFFIDISTCMSVAAVQIKAQSILFRCACDIVVTISDYRTIPNTLLSNESASYYGNNRGKAIWNIVFA